MGALQRKDFDPKTVRFADSQFSEGNRRATGSGRVHSQGQKIENGFFVIGR